MAMVKYGAICRCGVCACAWHTNNSNDIITCTWTGSKWARDNHANTTQYSIFVEKFHENQFVWLLCSGCHVQNECVSCYFEWHSRLVWMCETIENYSFQCNLSQWIDIERIMWEVNRWWMRSMTDESNLGIFRKRNIDSFPISPFIKWRDKWIPNRQNQLDDSENACSH